MHLHFCLIVFSLLFAPAALAIDPCQMGKGTIKTIASQNTCLSDRIAKVERELSSLIKLRKATPQTTRYIKGTLTNLDRMNDIEVKVSKFIKDTKEHRSESERNKYLRIGVDGAEPLIKEYSDLLTQKK